VNLHPSVHRGPASGRAARRPGAAGPLLVLVIAAVACGGGGGASPAAPAGPAALAVVHTVPAPGAIDVAADAAIVLEFGSAEVAATVTASLEALDPSGGPPAPVPASWAVAGAQGTLAPQAPLAAGGQYQATAVSAGGASYRLGFTVAAASTTDAHPTHDAPPVAQPIACAECHAPHGGMDHLLHFGPLANAGGATATWDPATATCSNYCHGQTLGGGLVTSPIWTRVDGSQAFCGSCHGLPPPAPHPALVTACGACHPGYTATSVNLALHINGAVDLGGTGTGCDGCHGFPPATGAHATHVGFAPPAQVYGDTAILQDLFPADTPTTAPSTYFFGCGNCHPLDPARHMDGTVEVELWSPAAPPGSLKARSAATAAYDPATGRCSGAYCHSSGQLAPSWIRPRDGSAILSPGWRSGEHLGCGGCHDDPPAYPSGGAGAPTANNHLVLADDGFEAGHFGGFPSAWHVSNHGSPNPGEGASAVTCQTCHVDTVDPARTGPSGFYYLDTTGNYDLGGGLGLVCTSCHTPGDPLAPTGAGGALPLRHVNGSREVVLDRRAVLPAFPGLPAAPNTPTRPIWEAPGGLSPTDFGPDMAYDGTTLSAHLGSAAYDPATKTCTNVSCHLAGTSVVWGGPTGWVACSTCHGF